MGGEAEVAGAWSTLHCPHVAQPSLVADKNGSTASSGIVKQGPQLNLGKVTFDHAFQDVRGEFDV